MTCLTLTNILQKVQGIQEQNKSDSCIKLAVVAHLAKGKQ